MIRIVRLKKLYKYTVGDRSLKFGDQESDEEDMSDEENLEGRMF